MAPRIQEVNKYEAIVLDHQVKPGERENIKGEVKWFNVIVTSMIHVGAIVGLYLCFTLQVYYQTVLCAYLMWFLSNVGVTAGAHRLWSHRSYKARLPMKLILAMLHGMGNQHSIYVWARDHRVHHKFAETDADPHNAKRGFFFSHMGWILSKKHPEVALKGKQIDLSDLHRDAVVMLEHRYHAVGVILFCFIAPTVIPWYFWGESLYNAFFVCSIMRWCFSLHSIWFVNSLAHMHGRRPYDKGIGAVENRFVSWLAVGEGFHNYHHTFPWDYGVNDIGLDFNAVKYFIDFFAFIGLAYDRRVVSPEIIKARKVRTGDVDELGPYGLHNH